MKGYVSTYLSVGELPRAFSRRYGEEPECGRPTLHGGDRPVVIHTDDWLGALGQQRLARGTSRRHSARRASWKRSSELV